jgi:hypothetical protein
MLEGGRKETIIQQYVLWSNSTAITVISWSMVLLVKQSHSVSEDIVMECKNLVMSSVVYVKCFVTY